MPAIQTPLNGQTYHSEPPITWRALVSSPQVHLNPRRLSPGKSMRFVELSCCCRPSRLSLREVNRVPHHEVGRHSVQNHLLSREPCISTTSISDTRTVLPLWKSSASIVPRPISSTFGSLMLSFLYHPAPSLRNRFAFSRPSLRNFSHYTFSGRYPHNIISSLLHHPRLLARGAAGQTSPNRSPLPDGTLYLPLHLL